MSQNRPNQQGFSVIEIIMVLVIVALLAVVGYMFYKGHKKATPKATATKTTIAATNPVPAAADPYVGWTSATLKYEKISYKYPAGWTVSDISTAHPKSENGCVYPGSDDLTLTSPTKESVELHTGVYCIGDAGSKAYQADAISSLGQSLYLVYQNNFSEALDMNPTGPAFACLSTTQDPQSFLSMTTKNIFTLPDNKPTHASFCYYPFDRDNAAPTGGSVKAIQTSKDFDIAKLIFESMKY